MLETHCNRVVLLIFTKCILVNYVLGHECYVCGGDAEISCDNFNPSNLELYAKICPPDHNKGCSLQKSDGSVVRSCEAINLDDCKIANNINYCFCSKNLCNSGNKYTLPTDDEDNEELEGSGSTTIPTITTNNNVKKKTTSDSSILQPFFMNFLYIFLMTLYML